MLSTLIVALACCGQVSDQAQGAVSKNNVEEVFSRSLAAARRLTSIDFEATSDGWAAYGVPNRRSIRFAFMGEKYREQVNDMPVGAAHKPGLIVEVFDGECCQMFNGFTLDFAFSRKGKLRQHRTIKNPLVIPYGWLFSGAETRTWNPVMEEARWQRRREQAAVREDLRRPGCTVIEVHFANGYRHEIEFAEELDCYPLKWQSFSPDGKAISSCSVEEFRRFDSDEGLIVVPTKVVDVIHALPQVRPAKLTHRIDADTIEVNGELPDDLFVLSSALAKRIVDWDAGRIVDAETGTIEDRAQGRGQ